MSDSFFFLLHEVRYESLYPIVYEPHSTSSGSYIFGLIAGFLGQVLALVYNGKCSLTGTRKDALHAPWTSKYELQTLFGLTVNLVSVESTIVG
jgi:hypothetical protein